MVLIITLSIIIFFSDGMKIIKSKEWKEFIVFSTLIFISILLVFLKSINVITPVEILYKMFYPIGKIFFKFCT